MSTRCSIIIRSGNNNIYLYHHHDGYPSGVGSLLKSYLNSQPSTIWQYEEFIATDIVKNGIKYKDSSGLNCVDDTYEVACNLHGDIDYAYLIDCDNKCLKCYKKTYHNFLEDIFDFEKNWDVVDIPD